MEIYNWDAENNFNNFLIARSNKFNIYSHSEKNFLTIIGNLLLLFISDGNTS